MQNDLTKDEEVKQMVAQISSRVCGVCLQHSYCTMRFNTCPKTVQALQELRYSRRN